MNLVFDFDAEPEVTRLSPGDNSATPKVDALAEPAAATFDDALAAVQPAGNDDHHPLAFAAVCRHLGIDHPALTPTSVGAILSGDGKRTLPGARRYDARELARLANHILRSIASDRPTMTPERWREAADAAPDWLTCEKIVAAQKGGRSS